MHTDEVRTGEHVFQAAALADLRGQFPGPVQREGRVVAEHSHTQPDGGVGHLHAYRAQTHHAHDPAGQFVAREPLLVRLYGLAQLFGRQVQFPQLVPGRQEITGGHHHTGHDQFFDGIRVGAGGVQHRHAPLRQCVHRDIVHTGAGARHDLDTVGYRFRVQVM